MQGPRALRPAVAAPALPRGAVLAQAAAFTLLNPHVYLGTVLLVGSVGAQHPPAPRAAFVTGAALASAGWFMALDYGARRLAPVFVGPRAWQLLDLGIGLAMLVLAARARGRLIRRRAPPARWLKLAA